MNRRSALFSLASMFAAAAWVKAQQVDQPAAADPRLTVEEIVRLSRAGVAEDLIITKIKKNGKAFDLSTDELVDLKKDSVSDTVVKYMLDPSQPYSPSAPAAPKAMKKYPADPLASRVPADPGLYLVDSSAPVRVDLKIILGSEEPKGFMKKKGKSVAYLLGPAAEVRLKNPLAPFYLRLPDGTHIEELLLVNFSPVNGRRELDVGASAPKQQYNPGDIHPFDSLEIGPQLYRLTPSNLAAGEYLFLFIGSADTAKGIYGKGYDFAVDQQQRQLPPKKPSKK